MPELQRLRAEHEPAVLAFELANRSYFAAFISDRGEEFFTEFASGFAELLAEQQKGRYAYFVLVADDGAIVGRFNLRDIDSRSAVLGYRSRRTSLVMASRRGTSTSSAATRRRHSGCAKSGRPRPTRTLPPGESCSRLASSSSAPPTQLSSAESPAAGTNG